MEHTATPWRSDVDNIYSGGYYIAKIVHGGTDKAIKVDAEFVVRACNAHDELLEALKGLIALLEDDGSYSAHEYEQEMLIAEHAIAKAEGND